MLSTKSIPSESYSSTNSTSTSEDKPYPSISYEYLKTDPAFNPVEVITSKPPPARNTVPGPKTLQGGVKGATKEIIGTVLHPRRAVIHHYRAKTAKYLASPKRPYISPTSNRGFLAAHDETTDGNSSGRKRRKTGNKTSRTNPSCEQDSSGRSGEKMAMNGVESTSLAKMEASNVEKLESHRQSLAVAWMTGRHIKRVRLAPSRVVDYPRLDDEKFMEKDDSNTVVRFKWERYIAQLLLYHSQDFTARYVDEGVAELPYDTVTFARYIERLVMATEPWQSWFMDIRQIYRWENHVGQPCGMLSLQCCGIRSMLSGLW
ncbi:hypothetical protein VTN77DRAFT_7662 [Rasamsonia byssochlamydoides]|uniref:uncharacterized protein n=1 Tax=Rasamsonia byssochlamydoides TaxID=89139 RepID=UPI003743C6BC